MINFVGKVSWHLLPTSAAAEMGQPAGKTNVTDGEVACDTKVHPQLRWLRREMPKPGTKRARLTVPLFILIKGDRCYGCCVMSCCLIIPWETWEKKRGHGHMNSGTDEKDVNGGIEEWLGMQSHLIMMTGILWSKLEEVEFLDLCLCLLSLVLGKNPWRKGLLGVGKLLFSLPSYWYNLPRWSFPLVLRFLSLVTGLY